MNNLKKYRFEKGLHQTDLAKAAGITRQTIIELEAGRRKPSFNTAFKISLVLGKSVEDIFSSKCNARSTKEKMVE